MLKYISTFGTLSMWYDPTHCVENTLRLVSSTKTNYYKNELFQIGQMAILPSKVDNSVKIIP